MELKDYLHLYLPVAVELDNGGSKVYNRTAVAVGNTDDEYRYVTLRLGKGLKSFTNSVLLSENRVKPILRPLSDINFAELYAVAKADAYHNYESMEDAVQTARNIIKSNEFRPQTLLCLLGMGFDLFGLIEAGLAIDRSTINQKK